MMHACFLLNNTCAKTINTTPLQAATGSACEVIPLLRFTFCLPVYFVADDSTFGSDSLEEYGRFGGIAENVGRAMTFKNLKDYTHKIVCRSNVRPGDEPFTSNLRMYPATMPAVVKSRQDTFTDDDTVSTTPPPSLTMMTTRSKILCLSSTLQTSREDPSSWENLKTVNTFV